MYPLYHKYGVIILCVQTTKLDGLVPIDDSVQTAGPDKENVSSMIYTRSCGFEGTHAGVSCLSAIPEEYVEDSKNEKEYQDVVKPLQVIGSAGFELNDEPNDLIPDIEQDQSVFTGESSVRFGGNGPNDLISTQLHEDAATNKPADNQEYASCSLTSPMISNSLLNVSGDSLAFSNEAHAKLNVIEEIDEELLAELDAVGDFHTGMPGKSAQSVMSQSELFDLELNAEEIVYIPKLHMLEELGLYSGDRERNVLPSGLEYSDDTCLKGAEVDAVESMVDDSALQVVKAHSLEDLHLAMRFLAGSSGETNMEIKSTTYPEIEGYDSQMPVVDVKSIEDIDFALKQLHEGHGKPINSENEPPVT